MHHVTLPHGVFTDSNLFNLSSPALTLQSLLTCYTIYYGYTELLAMGLLYYANFTVTYQATLLKTSK